MENHTIKSITPTSCPHCKKEFFVEFEMNPTTLSQVFTRDQMSDAKSDVLKEIGTMDDLDSIRKENIINWITDPETVFGPNEVHMIIKSLEENK